MLKKTNEIKALAAGIGVMFALSLILFAFGAFHGVVVGSPTTEFIIRLTPALLVLAFVLIGRRWPSVGSLLFAGLIGAYLLLLQNQLHWSLYIITIGPPALVGGLFLMAALQRESINT